MTRTFIQTAEFERNWKELEILKNPKTGAVMQGTGGHRKMRFAFEGTGKSGSVRVCYVDFVIHETVYLITVYPKNKKDNLSKTVRNGIKKLIELLGDFLE